MQEIIFACFLVFFLFALYFNVFSYISRQHLHEPRRKIRPENPVIIDCDAACIFDVFVFFIFYSPVFRRFHCVAREIINDVLPYIYFITNAAPLCLTRSRFHRKVCARTKIKIEKYRHFLGRTSLFFFFCGREK